MCVCVCGGGYRSCWNVLHFGKSAYVLFCDLCHAMAMRYTMPLSPGLGHGRNLKKKTKKKKGGERRGDGAVVKRDFFIASLHDLP